MSRWWKAEGGETRTGVGCSQKGRSCCAAQIVPCCLAVRIFFGGLITTERGGGGGLLPAPPRIEVGTYAPGPGLTGPRFLLTGGWYFGFQRSASDQ